MERRSYLISDGNHAHPHGWFSIMWKPVDLRREETVLLLHEVLDLREGHFFVTVQGL